MAEKIKTMPVDPHPIGSIYQSVDPTDPSQLFGGTWERLKDRFLLATGDTYPAGSTGGEAQHKLTVEEIPNYKIGDIPEVVPGNHENWNNGGVTGTNLGEASSSKFGVGDPNQTLMITSGIQWGYSISTAGGDQPHNNLPPYLAVYMWVRIA